MWYHKIVHWFFLRVRNHDLVVLGSLLRDNELMGAFCLYIVTYIIDMLTRAHSKLPTGLLCLCSTSEKVITVLTFFRFLFLYFLHSSQSIGQPSMLSNR